MWIVFSLICIISAYLTNVDSLQCAQCVSETAEACTEPVSPCPETDHSCKSLHLEIIPSDTEIKQFVLRICGNATYCDQLASLKIESFQIRLYISCCETDYCTPAPKAMPSFNSTANGRLCPTCMTRDSQTCNSEVMAKCQGDEDNCVTSNLVTKKNDTLFASFALRGCANEDDSSQAFRVLRIVKTISVQRSLLHIQPI
ncbi:phospholipase A2 inhibitor gamma subunit B-like [Discoglossus pictus]